MADEACSPETVEDAVEIIRVASALGMRISLPEGMNLYVAVIPYDNSEPDIVGMFLTVEAAETYLYNWVVQQWKSYSFNPSTEEWYDMQTPDSELTTIRDGWLSAHSPEDTIDLYNEKSEADDLRIVGYSIQPTPERCQ